LVSALKNFATTQNQVEVSNTPGAKGQVKVGTKLSAEVMLTDTLKGTLN
jgi:hypothetical protein